MTTSPFAAGSWAAASYKSGPYNQKPRWRDCCGWTMMRRDVNFCPGAFPPGKGTELCHLSMSKEAKQLEPEVSSFFSPTAGRARLFLFKLYHPGGGTGKIWDTGSKRVGAGLLLLSLCREPSGRISHSNQATLHIILSSEFSSVDRESFMGDALLGKLFP